MKKSTYLTIAVIILLMLGVLVLFAFTGKNNKTNQAMNQNVMTKEEVKQNEQVNEQVKEETTNIIEKAISNEETQNVEENTTSTETFEESPKTAEEKALELVKKDWGEDNQVEFLIEGIEENGNYIVTIRNVQTTEAKAFYSVNVSNGTFTKKEMN